MKFRKYALTALMATLMMEGATAQQKLSREQIMNMTSEELSEMPLEKLMEAVEILGVSSVDELFAMIMNKNVSSASKKDESAFTSPLATTVITREEMRSYGCKSIEEAFRLIPGAIVTQKTNGIYDIQLRGLNNIPDGNLLLYTENSNVLLMVDGRVVHNYSIGTMTMENLPISIIDIERIEVVRGACSALYGVNAVNGVINIITKRPNETQETVSGQVTGGNLGTMSAEAAYHKTVNDKVSFRVTANFQQRSRPTDKLYTSPASDTYIATSAVELNGRYTDEQIDAMVKTGDLEPIEGSQLLDVDKFGHMVKFATSTRLDGTKQAYYATPTEYRNAVDCFDDSEIARRNVGFNGYVDITPAKDVDIRITGGYAQSLAMQTTVMESPYTFAFREFKKGYANADVRVKGLHAQANFYAGPEDYAKGRPGLQADFKQIFASADYDINVGELNIRPGVYFQYMKGKDKKKTYDYGDGKVELSGFFNDEAKLQSFAPSVRLDYTLNNWRFIAAARADKTNIPDKWNVSLQGVVDYKFDNHNFIRLNYGRGVRSANMLNANSNYRWQRTGMDHPNIIEFFGNTEADLVSIDNFELGYRWQPTSTLLIDAEVFHSRSKDYGAMMSYDSKAVTTYTNMYTSIAQICAMADETGKINVDEATDYLLANINSRSNSSYGNLPYKVAQTGISLNIDWIISPKVVAKLNANWQQTLIDNYYLYNQNSALNEQFYENGGIIENLSRGMKDIVYCIEGKSTDGNETVCTDPSRLGNNIVSAISTISHSNTYEKMFNNMTAEMQEQFLSALRNAYFNTNDFLMDEEGQFGRKKASYQNCLALYYALKYGMDYDSKNKEYKFSQSDATENKRVNGHKHKSTPSIYGMAGVIIKPNQALNISAYANFMGKRTYQTSYGTEEMDNKVTLNARVGYKLPIGLEIFIAGDNLLNDNKKEFVYSDKVGGVYTGGFRFDL